MVDFSFLDPFGVLVQQTYNQKKTFKTKLGAIVGLLIKIGILVYFFILLTNVLKYENYTLTTSEYQRNFYYDKSYINIKQEYFDMGISIAYSGPNTELKTKPWLYFHVQFRSVISRYVVGEGVGGFTGFTWEPTIIETERCQEDRYGKDTVGRGVNLTSYFCPKVVDFNLSGDSTSYYKSLFTYRVMYCNQTWLDQHYPGSKCKTQQEYRENFNNTNMLISFKTQYFDHKEYNENPIKSAYTNFVAQSSNNISLYQRLMLTQNQAILQDSQLFPGLNVQNETFFNIKYIQDYNPSVDFGGDLLTAFVFQDQLVKTVERRAFTVVDAAQKVGGMLSLINLIAAFLMSYYQNTNFWNEIINKTIFLQSQADSQGKKVNQTHNDYKAIQDNITMRQKPQFSFFETLKLRCTRERESQRKRFYQKSLAKITEELDIVNYIRLYRTVEFLQKAILPKPVQKLVGFYNYHVIDDYDQVKIKIKDTKEGSTLEQNLKKVYNSQGKLEKKTIQMLMFEKKSKKTVYKQTPSTNNKTSQNNILQKKKRRQQDLSSSQREFLKNQGDGLSIESFDHQKQNQNEEAINYLKLKSKVQKGKTKVEKIDTQ